MKPAGAADFNNLFLVGRSEYDEDAQAWTVTPEGFHLTMQRMFAATQAYLGQLDVRPLDSPHGAPGELATAKLFLERTEGGVRLDGETEVRMAATRRTRTTTPTISPKR